MVKWSMVKWSNKIIFWLAPLIVVAAALLYFEADLLWKVQQHNIFLDTSLFFQQMMAVPGGMLSYLGTYFSQHFYYPWVGVILLCGWWLLLMWLTKRAFNISDRWTVLTFLPVAILLVANVCLGYWIYVIKMPGYFYVATIGTTAATALLWAFRKLHESTPVWVRVTFIFVVTLVGYPLMGVYALAAVALMAVMAWPSNGQRSTVNGQRSTVNGQRSMVNGQRSMVNGQRSNLKSKISILLVALLSIIAIPLFYYRFVYVGTNIIDMWRTGIPVFQVAESYPVFYIPYYALGACFLLMALVGTNHKPHASNIKPQASNVKSKTAIVPYLLPGIVLVIIAGGIYHFWYKDSNFHHELRMQRCVEQADWEGVIEEGTKQDCEPTRAIVMMHNLALSRLGRQCDEMYKFRKGSKKSNTPLPVFMYQVAGRMMLYQYGAMNECHRVCMEEGVEYGWNIDQLKYLARCAIFNKEQQAARKFLDILRQTSYYGSWADRMEKLINDPQQLAKDSKTGPITHMMHYTDRLDAVEGAIEKHLMTSLAEQDADDVYFQEQAVIAALWTRNPDLFWPRFEHYIALHGDGNVPRIFQEAAWLFANMQGQDGLDEWVLAPGIRESMASFIKQMQQYTKTKNRNMKQLMYPFFGTTYYYEYFFLKDITYY